MLLQLSTWNPNKGGVLNKSSELLTAGKIHNLSCEKKNASFFSVLGLIFFLIYDIFCCIRELA